MNNRIGDLGLLIGIFIIGSMFSTVDTTLKRLRLLLDIDLYFPSAAALALFTVLAVNQQIPLYTLFRDG
jgi:NADH-quinone oxidoreductase subunit L